ncbi:CopG family transcriptional regulator [Sandarakinorhabdus sp. DWP1-3-1]|uniref:CopG family transcriptional regulator n=1 Tax=Sandarakinorhabdus sp. DWP1-3-1 TaxID=2804627 RepID=UPI003CF8F394
MLNETSSLGLRIDTQLESRLAAVAKTQGRSKSEVARDAVRLRVDRNDVALRAEARRQSLNAAARGWTEEEAYWESSAASNEADRAGPQSDD